MNRPSGNAELRQDPLCKANTLPPRRPRFRAPTAAMAAGPRPANRRPSASLPRPGPSAARLRPPGAESAEIHRFEQRPLATLWSRVPARATRCRDRARRWKGQPGSHESEPNVRLEPAIHRLSWPWSKSASSVAWGTVVPSLNVSGTSKTTLTRIDPCCKRSRRKVKPPNGRSERWTRLWRRLARRGSRR